MRGEPGTPIKLTIVRPGRDKPFDVSMIRERIELRPVKWEIKDGIGYHQHQHLRRQRRRPDQGGADGDRQGDRRPSAGLCRRPSLQPGRPARPGGRCQRRLPRTAARSFPSAAATKDDIERYYATPGRHGPWPAGDRPDRRRHRLGVGDRRRRAAGPPPRAGHGRDELRQGLGPDRRPDRAGSRAAADHGALLHAVGPLGSGRRDRPGHRRAAASRPRLQGPPGSSAKPTFAATCSPRPRSRTSCSKPTTCPIRASWRPPAELEKKGIKDFQLYYAIKTLKRLAPPAHRLGRSAKKSR